ncbi:MAG: hypothetical protein KAG26_08985, partial [Methylococcales bacterium]|nr:hypothetical protein [Methylococcales bacterium]
MAAYRSTVMLAGAVCLLIFSGWVHARNAIVTIEDTSPLHVHSPGKRFKIKVKVDYSGSEANVSGQWHNYTGQLLGAPVSLPLGNTVTLSSPATDSGYYELRLKSRASDLIFPNRRAGESREYGFAILPDRSMDQRISDINTRFGVVHGDLNDPYLPIWIKTLTWHKSQKTWQIEIDQRRARKLLELPIVTREDWVSDGNQPISQADLSTLKSRISGYFQADPQVLYWELGLEENLDWKNFSAPHFLPNLEKKVKVVREAADAINPDIQLIYQLATTNVTKDVIGAFLNSGASKIFDILSLHPYRWEDDDET